MHAIATIPDPVPPLARFLARAGLAPLLLLAASLAACGEKSSPSSPAPGVLGLSVASTGPAAGATSVPVTASFSVKLSAPVDPATATTAAFKLFVGSSEVPGTVSASDSTVTFTPRIPLLTSTSYVARVTTALKDQNGRALAADHVWSVTTQAGQSLGGILSASTTLTLASSPYLLTSDLQIAYGATLTLEPGVVIDGQNRRIRVYGGLAAIGTAQAPVTLLGVQVEPGANAPAQPYTITIQHALVDRGRIYDATGNAVYGSLVIRDSKLLGLQSYLYVWYPVADCFIERNVFVGCGGISAGTSGGVRLYVRNNVFHEQTDEYAVQNWTSISGGETIVALNSFLSTDRVALSLPPGYTSAHLTATDNYWGTTNASTIAAMIFDQNDDLSSSEVVVFQPILSSPDAATPDPAPWIPPGP